MSLQTCLADQHQALLDFEQLLVEENTLLLRSFEILEKVVLSKRLFLSPAEPGDSSLFAAFAARSKLTGAPSVTVRSDRRPVPLEFEYSETPLTERVAALLAVGALPAIWTSRGSQEAPADPVATTESTPLEAEVMRTVGSLKVTASAPEWPRKATLPR